MTTQKMNPAVKAEWLNALRSGEYSQGMGKLKDGEGNFCCLGVLCDLNAKATGQEWEEAESPAGETPHYYGYRSETGKFWYGWLPDFVAKWAGLPSDGDVEVGDKWLSRMNDTGSTFGEIADVIEAGL